MAWIESHQALAKHRKTLHMVAELKVDRHKLLGHLHELWWWGLDNADVNGHVGHVSDEVLAEAAGWPLTTSGRWVAALLTAGGENQAGFLEVDDTGFILHDWYTYAGRYNEQRERNRVRMQANRAANTIGVSTDTVAAHVAHVQHTSGTRAPNVHVNGAGTFGATGPTGPDQPPVGPLNATSPARARAPDVAPPRGTPTNEEGLAESEQCPLCPEQFATRAELREHLDNSPRHKVRDEPDLTVNNLAFKKPSSSKRRGTEATAAEVDAELEAMKDRGQLKHADLPPDLLAEHQRLLDQERQRAKPGREN